MPARTREPRQQRSRAGVERLLNAVEHILATDGYDALTIARITKTADVAVGTFYQFFGDKDAIVEVLALRYVDQTRALIDNLVGAIVELPPGTRLAAALEAFISLYRSNSAYQAIRAGSYSSAALRRADDANVSAAVDGIRRLLTTGTGVEDSDRVRSSARTLQLIVDALLYRASEVPRRDVQPFVAEAGSMLNRLEHDTITRLRGPNRG